ncbi:radical SAM protein [Candidatus Woesearchaeota archaeon]|jgi:uncharacterized protein|nr:radical SAM protein [Candidatus Woesearchaeota archaeon]MBT4110924.1 radical SAM protein [Candidatus Woesearchaeota archaeon]MBT4336564.1 radical SAM protein [Candidatus Woesearchaeota archaeon]MBT4469687.1 radical SAM protein [Candidatus Woesearchaeota archaeon]MBT6744049.1 radical SAM protein [Candidatus Woesearchaeota archaeon]
MIKENKYYSYNLNSLPRGCRYCVKGEKLVLFVTGICPRKCYFCPVSDEKWGKDITFANERRVFCSDDVVKEAKLMNAKGAGITGGDPLSKLDRTVRSIMKLKKEFGKEFHIHLYTSLRLVNDDALQKLFMAGLDEIRFHLDLESNQFWNRLEIARKFPWDMGVEIPLIPGKEKETKAIVDYIQGKVDFLNFNELEVADNSCSKLLDMGFKVKDQMSYAILGSMDIGLDLLDYVSNKYPDFNLHLCTAKLKDAVQLANRIKNEAKGAKKDFDIVDEEGLLVRGALYFSELKPGFNYREMLKEDNSVVVSKLKELFASVQKKLKLEDNEIFLDKSKPRILVSKKVVKKNKTKIINLGLVPAIVTEYPTADQLEIEVDFLN